QFKKSPQMIEINKKNVTLNNIEQFYIDAPMGRKMDALNLIIRYYNPTLAIIFCNTKHMVDEIAEYLTKCGLNAEGLHGDMKQSQRTKVMDSFKYGKTQILVATDVAARGIDVNDIEYVINYDIPQNTEYYIHRIGRTGRAGKAGKAVTMCSGRRQVYTMRDIGRQVKSEIQMLDIPSLKDIQKRSVESNTVLMENTLKEEINGIYDEMVKELVIKGFSLENIAAAALQLNFGKAEKEIVEVKSANSGVKFDGGNVSHRKMEIDIGRDSRVAPNHIVGAITEQTGINGSDIGKIEIFDNKTVVGIPAARIEEVAQAMQGCKICGRPTNTTILADKPFNGSRNGGNGGGYRKSSSSGGRGGYRGGSRGGKSGGYRNKND
ncbi:MAG: DEAD/DEAH box helicase, partial [Oscillospiraceae bacterium]